MEWATSDCSLGGSLISGSFLVGPAKLMRLLLVSRLGLPDIIIIWLLEAAAVISVRTNNQQVATAAATCCCCFWSFATAKWPQLAPPNLRWEASKKRRRRIRRRWATTTNNGEKSKRVAILYGPFDLCICEYCSSSLLVEIPNKLATTHSEQTFLSLNSYLNAPTNNSNRTQTQVDGLRVQSSLIGLAFFVPIRHTSSLIAKIGNLLFRTELYI